MVYAKHGGKKGETAMNKDLFDDIIYHIVHYDELEEEKPMTIYEAEKELVFIINKKVKDFATREIICRSSAGW